MSGFNPPKETRCNEFRRSSRNTLVCDVSGDNIYAGDRYRELIIVEGDRYERKVALVDAVRKNRDWDVFTLVPEDEALAPLREKYGHRWRVGAQVMHLGLTATIVGASGDRHVIIERAGLREVQPVAGLVMP